MTATDIYSANLPATRTHDERSITFVPAAVGKPYLGTVTIRQGRAFETYMLTGDVADGRRVLIFEKLPDRASRIVYETEGGWACTCAGDHFLRRCKHAAAVSQMEADGVLPVPGAIDPPPKPRRVGPYVPLVWPAEVPF